MNSLIETVVAKLLSPYLEGISRENLTLGILSGKVSLRNLKIKPSILEDLKLHQLRIISATVETVQVDIPWKNPLGGKIIIDVSGVHTRLAFSQNLSHDQLVALKRNAIDEIKKKLMDEMQNKATEERFIQGDSYAAKLVRKLINSLTISVREIDISLILVHSLGSVPASDVDGFADAASQCSESSDDDPCEIRIQLDEFGLSELVSSEKKLNSKTMSKQFSISGVSVWLAGSPLLPSTSLFVDLVHSPSVSDVSTTSFLSIHIHGVDRCNIRVERSQLVKLKEGLINSPSSLNPVPLTSELRRRYIEVYSAQSKQIEDYYFLFSAVDLAKAELLVDSQRPDLQTDTIPPPRISPPWWKLGFGGAVESSDSTIEKFREDILAELESTKDEVPSLISFQLDMGRDWTVQLVQNSSIFVTVHLWGGRVGCDITTGTEKGFDVRILSAGLSIFQGTEKLLLDFREQTISFDKMTLNASKSMLIDSTMMETSSAFMDAQESAVGTEYITYTAADIQIMYKKRQTEAELSLSVSIQPLTLTFQPGIIESGYNFFSFLSDPVVVDSLEELMKNRDAILARGKELIDSVQESQLVSEALSSQTYLTLNLNISGPLLVLPSDVSGEQQIVITLGEMMINLPRTCVSDSDKPPIYVLLEKISISCVVTDLPDDDDAGSLDPQKTAMQVLSPTAMEVSLSHSPGGVQLDLNMNEQISFRMSPEIIAVISRFVAGIKAELNSIPSKVGVSVDLSSNQADDSVSALPMFSTTLSLNIKNFRLILSDGALDVLSFETSVPNFSLAYVGELSGSLERVRIIARYYNSGNWEPILEPSYFSGFFQTTKSDITVRLRAVSAVNAVLTPSLLRTGLWISKLLDNPDPQTRMASKRFRVINCTNVPVYVSIRRIAGRQPKIITIPPSSSPTYIDHWVLAYSAREVFVSTENDPRKLVRFTLDSSASTGILRVPLDKGYCEALAPILVQSLSMGDTSVSSSRCLLISYETFFFNQCDVPLIVRGVGRGPLPTPLSYLIGVPSLAGAGSVTTVSTVSSMDEQPKIRPDQVVLQPGTFISVPDFPETNWSVSNSDFHHQTLSLDWVDFARKATLSEQPNFIFNVDCGRGFNIRTDGLISETDYPNRGDLRQLFFRPPLVVSNSTPCTIRLSHSGKQSIFSLPPGESRNVHDLRAEDDLTRMSLNLSFVNIESEWSNSMFGPFAASPVAKDQPLLVRDGSQSPGRKVKKPVKISKFEERYLLSPEVNKVHPVHLTATAASSQSVTISIKWWLIDRTGLNLTVYGNNSLPLPRADNNGPVWLLPDPDTPITLKIFRGRSDYVQVTLPDSGWFDAKIGQYPLVFVSRENFVEKFVEIVPKYTVFNGLVDRPIFITNCFSDVLGDQDMLAPETGTVLMSDTFQFSLDVPANPQSVSIPMKETFAGVWPLDVDGSGNVVRLEIAPDCGSICVSIFAGSSVVVRNEKRKHSVEILVDNGNFFEVAPLTQRSIGWRDPFSHPQIETTMRILGDYFGGPQEFRVPLARAGDEIRYGGCVNVVAANEPQSIIVVVEKSHRDSYHHRVSYHETSSSVSAQRIMRVEFEANTVSASIIHQSKEVLYAELSLIKFLLLEDSVLRRVSTMISDIQVDTCVSRKPTSNPVILVNRGDSSRAFLEFTVDQNTNVSYGVSLIPLISIQLDDLLIEVDSKFMIALDDLINDLIDITTVRETSGRTNPTPAVPGADAVAVKKGTVSPVPAPPILILDVFEFGAISVRLWVDFALKTMGFMPVSLKLVVGVLSLGDSFKLDGAPVVLKRRNITGYKGSLIAFQESVVGDYANEALLCCATLLGSSSLLAIPRAPIHLISNVGAFGLEKATKAVGGIGDFISDWTSDSQYRDAQSKIRANKNIQGIGDGLVEGATRLGEGAEGLLDIFRKPVQGAKSDGCVGCLKGIGKGLVGTIFKPLTKVGEAVSDVGTGIVRTVKPSSSSKRPVLHRKRVPRPLYGRNRSIIGDYYELDAIVISKLPKELTKGVEVILPLAASPDSSAVSSCLILYPRKIAVVQLLFSKHLSRRDSRSFRSSRSQLSLLSTDKMDFTKIVSASVEQEITLKDIRTIAPVYHSNSLVVNDNFGVELTLRVLPPGPNGSIPTLLGAVQTAVATAVNRGYVDWSGVKSVYKDMMLEARDKALESMDDQFGDELGMKKTIQVIEVERFLMTYGWATPYMVLDSGNEAWRWLDKSMTRHSKIRPRLSRKDAANAKLPPISAGDLWKPLDEWTVVVDAATTDAIGWQYALSFNSSTWSARPGITASVRRRKWVRHYS